MKKLSYFLLAFSITIVIGIAVLIKPDKLDNISFLLALSWLVILVVFNWIIAVFFFTSDHEKNTTHFGILPSLHSIVFLYSVYSIVILIYFWHSSEYSTLPIIHWISQLIGLGIFGIIFILILIAGKTAQISIPIGAEPKEELLDKLKVLTLSLPNDFKTTKKLLKDLESTVRHSVSHPGATKYIRRYIDLSNRIMSLSLSDLTKSDSEGLIKELLILAKSC
jgi:hypothetical protein